MKKLFYFSIILLFIVSCESNDIPLKRNKIITDPHFTNEEMREMTDMCNRIHINVKDLLIVIENESNFDYKAVNPKSGAVGLIQWTPQTLSDFNLTTTDVLNMSISEQISLIEKYYKRYSLKYKLDTPIKLLLVTFYPYAVRRMNEPDYIIGSEKSRRYAELVGEQNFIYDINKDGVIQLWEFNKYHNEHLLKHYNNEK